MENTEYVFSVFNENNINNILVLLVNLVVGRKCFKTLTKANNSTHLLLYMKNIRSKRCQTYKTDH